MYRVLTDRFRFRFRFRWESMQEPAGWGNECMNAYILKVFLACILHIASMQRNRKRLSWLGLAWFGLLSVEEEEGGGGIGLDLGIIITEYRIPTYRTVTVTLTVAVAVSVNRRYISTYISWIRYVWLPDS